MGYFDTEKLQPLVGAKVTAISMTEDKLIFETDKGVFDYEVYGDCCSWSYFYDFVGAEKLLTNGPITGIKEVELESFEQGYDYVQCYGYQLFSEHPVWGEQTSVFSFRNDSNGYYGGELEGPLGETTEVDGNNLLTQHVHTVA